MGCTVCMLAGTACDTQCFAKHVAQAQQICRYKDEFCSKERKAFEAAVPVGSV